MRTSLARDPGRPPMTRLTLRDRFLAWIVTGPVGRLIAFVLDLGAALVNAVRRRGPGA
jgi:hypothetical protein